MHIAYSILEKLYIQKIPYKTVEMESGLNHRVFEYTRKNAIKEIQRLYESELTNAQIVRCSEMVKRNNRRKTGKGESYEQLSIFD